jgi:hypothetical protein
LSDSLRWPGSSRDPGFDSINEEDGLGTERKKELRRRRQRRSKRLKMRKKQAIYDAGKKRVAEAEPVEAGAAESE